MNNKKIYKLEAFNEKQERHRTLYIGEAAACFKMRDKDSLMHEWDTNRYYLTGSTGSATSWLKIALHFNLIIFNVLRQCL
jgi:hypothetical protein